MEAKSWPLHIYPFLKVSTIHQGRDSGLVNLHAQSLVYQELAVSRLSEDIFGLNRGILSTNNIPVYNFTEESTHHAFQS